MTDEPRSRHAEPAQAPLRRVRARARRRSSPHAPEPETPNVEVVEAERPALDQHRAPAPGRPRLARGALRLPPARLRGRLLAQPAPEGRRVRRLPVRRPALPALRQAGRAPERGRARHLRRARLPHHAAQRAARSRSSTSSSAAARARSSASSCSPRAPATCSTRSSTTASTPRSRCCARWATSSSASRRTSSRAARARSCATSPTSSRRSSTSARSSARSAPRCATSSARKRYIAEDLDIYFDDINDASERIWDMLENFKEVVEALEAHQRVGALAPRSTTSCAC